MLEPLPWLDDVTRVKRPARLPVVLVAVENVDMTLLSRLLYRTGMRLLEGLRLRVKDVDFVRREILVREGKGAKDRITMLPESLMQPLRAQVAKVKAQHDADLAMGRGEVWLPGALAVKYPAAPRLRQAFRVSGRGVRSPLDGLVAR